VLNMFDIAGGVLALFHQRLRRLVPFEIFKWPVLARRALTRLTTG
jgi:hypothetical protein